MIEQMKVLSFCHFIQGPAASQYLGDLGADVIKVEAPSGAWERTWGSGGIRVGGQAVSFLAGNRNKRSLVVDLKHPDARDILYPLVRQCDVVLENYRLGVLDRLGFGYEQLRGVKSDLIYASASGWGASGPMKDQPGVDLLVQARSGLVSVGGRERGGPGGFLGMPGVPLVDHHGGALLAMGVLAAYARKLLTGQGTRVETSLLAAGLDVQAESLALYGSSRRTAADIQRAGQLATWYADPPYGVYELADGHAVVGGTGPTWAFTQRIGAPELLELGEQGHREHRDRYVQQLAEVLRGWRYADLADRLAGTAFWHERVASYDDVLADPQVQAQQRFERLPVSGEEALLLRHPVSYDGRVPGVRRPPPRLGEHTVQILAEAGFTPEQIEQHLRSRAVVADA